MERQICILFLTRSARILHTGCAAQIRSGRDKHAHIARILRDFVGQGGRQFVPLDHSLLCAVADWVIGLAQGCSFKLHRIEI